MHAFDPGLIAPKFSLTYKFFVLILLEISRVFLVKGLVRFTLGENLVQVWRVANQPLSLECLVTEKEVSRLYLT